MKTTWVGPGVFGNDTLPGQQLPEGTDVATIERLVAAGKAVIGDLPVQSAVTDELATVKNQLAEAQQTAEGWKNIAETNANAHAELMASYREQEEQLAASQAAVTELTEQLAASQSAVTELTDRLSVTQNAITELTEQLAASQAAVTELTDTSLASAGPKSKEKPK